MGIYFLSSDPKRLLASFNESHSIKTWRFTLIHQKPHYTHTSEAWKDKAYLKPDDTEPDRLAFHVQRFHGTPLTKDVFAYYLGHLAETFIRDFPDQFSEVHLTSSPDPEDDDF
jgi:hypothetical protein